MSSYLSLCGGISNTLDTCTAQTKTFTVEFKILVNIIAVLKNLIACHKSVVNIQDDVSVFGLSHI